MNLEKISALLDVDLDDGDPDALEVPFKRHRGKTVMELALEEDGPGYLRWAQKATDWGTTFSGTIDKALQRVVERKISEAPPLRLTSHQEQISDTLLLHAAPGSVLRLNGGAGYGKSYVTRKIATELAKRGYTCHAAAVSYVATQVLAQQLNPYGVESATIARTLKYTKRWENGNEVYEHSADTPREASALLSQGKALIVDECSMLAEQDANLLVSSVRRGGGLLVVVGDDAQLPPVKQEHLSSFHEDATSTLTIPMRYSQDSDLYQVEQTARTTPWGLADVLQRTAGSSQVARVPDSRELVNEYIGNYRTDPDALHRILLFRRRDVVGANNAVRRGLFGADANVIEEDEQLMVLATTDTPYADDDTANTHRYYSGQTFRVTDLEEDTYRITIDGAPFEIPHYRVQFDDDAAPVRIVFGVTEQQMDLDKLGSGEFQAALSAAGAYGRKTNATGDRLGSWEPYKQLQGDFLRVAYTYATSVHRAQGQTLDYAYTIPRPLLAVPGLMGRALSYVANTRAKQRLTVLL